MTAAPKLALCQMLPPKALALNPPTARSPATLDNADIFAKNLPCASPQNFRQKLAPCAKSKLPQKICARGLAQ